MGRFHRYGDGKVGFQFLDSSLAFRVWGVRTWQGRARRSLSLLRSLSLSLSLSLSHTHTPGQAGPEGGSLALSLSLSRALSLSHTHAPGKAEPEDRGVHPPPPDVAGFRLHAFGV